MKILIVHPQMALYGGAELVVVKLARYLEKKKHDVTIMTLSTDGHEEYNGLKFILPPENKRISYRLRGGVNTFYDIIKMHFTLKELCKNIEEYDVINVHNFPAIWAVPKQKNIVWMCNEVPDLWHNAKVNGIINKIFNIARVYDKLKVNSKKPLSIVADTRCADIFRSRYGINPAIVNYGIDDYFATCNHKPSVNEFRIICPAMISPSKNQLGILQAIQAARKYIPNIKVTLSGYRDPEHPYSVSLDKYIKDVNLDVDYLPPTSREELRDVYSKSTVAVFAGKGQGSWLSPFELLSMAVPVIVTPNLTCSDIIKDRGIGIVTDDITRALINVYKGYTWHKVKAKMGQKYVLGNLTWDDYGKKVERLLARAGNERTN